MTTQQIQAPRPVGELLRHWRESRRLSQLKLANRADVSTRHLSFVENGRSAPSRDMVLNLAQQLELPLRERNHLLLAAGYAPIYSENGMDSPQISILRNAVRQMIAVHAPNPAVVIDRDWNIVDANIGLAMFTKGAAEHLLAKPINAMRLALHPDGMAARIINLGEWRTHLLGRVSRRLAVNNDPGLAALYKELLTYPGETTDPAPDPHGLGELMIPLRLRDGRHDLTFFCTTTVFGTPLDVTLSELAIEQFFPADAQTAELVRQSAAWAELDQPRA